jgi:hypothetical protein
MRKKTSTIIGIVVATILTVSALTLSNQAFAQPGPIGGGGGGGGGGGSGGVPSGGNGGDGYIPITLLGQSASNSGHVVHSGLPGQIQTHPMQEAAGNSIITYLRAHGISTSTYIRNVLIPAAKQHIYGTGLGIGVLHKLAP